MAQFEFDPINFGAGVGAGVLTTLAVQRLYRFAREFGQDNEKAVVRTFATRAADPGYLQALVLQAKKAHILGHKLPLNQLLVEPRFIPPPDVLERPEEDEPMDEVFTIIPQVHDYPFLYQPYNVHTLSIADLSRGNKSIALIGLQGSGRTTALFSIALWSAGFIEFEAPRDEIIEEIEANLDPKKDVSIDEQVKRVRNRVARSELTRGRYRGGVIPDESDEAPRDPTEDDDEILLEASSRFRRIAPIYVHLSDIILESGEYGREIDPLEPMVRAMQHQAGWLSSKRLVNKTYKLMEEGSGLVLIDGYDDIPEDNRPAAIRWVRALMALYPENFYITAMPPQGYGLLMEAGAVPVYLRPWSDQDIGDSIDKVVASWDELSKREIEFDVNQYQELQNYVNQFKDARQLHPLDLTLRSWAIFNGHDLEEMTQSHIMQAYLEELFPKAPDLMPELQRFATLQLDYGHITLSNLVDYAMQKMTDSGDIRLKMTITSEVATISTSEAESVADDSSDTAKEEAKMRQKLEREQGKLLEQLVKQEVLIVRRKGRYQFRHKILASYLAALDLVDTEEYIVYRKYRKPNWDYAMNYLAQLRDVDFLVAEQLDNPLDVRFENILKLTNWLKFAGADAPWRGNLLRYLGNLMAGNNQFTVVRERIASALVSARDDGARVVFRRSLKTSSPSMRRIGALALGAIRDEGALEALTQVVFQDSEIENRIAGIMGLSAIGSEEALIAVLDLVDMAQNEEVRRAATEMLALNREVGYPTLYDALESESIAMRRAALFGIGRIPTDWAWIMIDRVYQRETESFVRLAAEVVLRKKFDSYFYQLDSYPLPTEAPWLLEWAEDQREVGNIPYDMEIEDVLNYAFEQTEDDTVRWLMTGTIGQLGDYEQLNTIYEALDDDQELIRDQAYRTLAIFQERLGTPIIAPAE